MRDVNKHFSFSYKKQNIFNVTVVDNNCMYNIDNYIVLTI